MYNDDQDAGDAFEECLIFQNFPQDHLSSNLTNWSRPQLCLLHLNRPQFLRVHDFGKRTFDLDIKP